ncbi:predicted protein [Phaeodactylum tricornutum CCAP 1055/1]|jgi:hypothetical protein|uniref:Uncharacterized protein n=2 Tax=Phaeodactylum tricornutum TaxID=2850 RepID=B7FYA3_PHATC|nr:predicted protein [Phaeodactylum tricornutum CCAP 1055/1]EEC48688.1 predicted protein [Phaeodactylum tricornutum CCAP 1055/1]|eukprot:XP_002179702.1 predicted protein [Phaeodactylum tricornutum CCAP 1055/1]
MTIPVETAPQQNEDGTALWGANRAEESASTTPCDPESSAAEDPDLEIAADSDDDDLTVIVLHPTNDENNRQQEMISWIEQAGPEMENRRRNVLLRELRRVQRASFFHFALLCLIPTILLLIVVATVVGEDENCESEATFCTLETRTFINAFTTRCICDAIPIQSLD